MAELVSKFERQRGTPPAPEFAQLRRVPIQPEGLPLGRVYLGVELGFAQFSGQPPTPGDVVLVLGTPGNYVALPQEEPPQRNPIFAPSACRCRCPASTTGGQLAYQNNLIFTPLLLFIDGGTGEYNYRSLLPEALNAEGIAIDPEEPHNLYVMDNRSTYDNLVTDATPNQKDPDKNYYTLLTYQLTGGSYVLSDVNVLPGADFINGHDGEPITDICNCLSVVDGIVWITRTGAPARFFTWDGNAFTSLTLTQDGVDLDTELAGPVVRIPDKPANGNAMFVASRFGDVIQFTEEGIVEALVTIENFPNLGGLVVVCNRLIAVERQAQSRREAQGSVQAGGEGEGGGEEN